MKQYFALALIFLLTLNLVQAQTAHKPRYLKPLKAQKSIPVRIAGKNKHYYPVNSTESSVIIVSGPGKLQVLTRGRFTAETKGKLKYTLLYSVDGGKQKSISETAVPRSEKASFPESPSDFPAQLQTFEIQLGPGSHTLEFKLRDNTVQVAARYKFTPVNTRKKDWLPFSPMQPSEPVDLVTKEEIVKYYRFSATNPLKIEVTGPTKLQLLSRFENHFQMKGAILYRLQIKEKGKVLNTYQLSNRTSGITVYKNNEKLIPGKASEIMINVPKGSHIYEIIPLDQDKNTLLGRVLIPKKDAH